jgi:hypothetical protein
MTDIAKLVGELTLDEKAALTAGADLWSTTAVPRLGIPARPSQPAPRRCRCGAHPVPPRMPGWQVDPGRYELHIGRSSAAIDHVLAVDIIA